MVHKQAWSALYNVKDAKDKSALFNLNKTSSDARLAKGTDETATIGKAAISRNNYFRDTFKNEFFKLQCIVP